MSDKTKANKSAKPAKGAKMDRFTESMLPETDGKIFKWAGTFMIVAACAAFYLSTVELIVDEMMFEDVEGEELTASMKMEEKKEEKKKEKKKNKKKRKKTGGGGKQRGKGTPNAPQTRGVLKMLTTKTSKSGFSAYSLMKSNFSKDLTKDLSKVAGLQKTGKTKLGSRRGSANGSFNSGYAEGGSGGIGDMLGGLLGGSGGAISTSAKGKLKPPSARDIDMGSGGGTRSKSSIMRVVRARTPGLRSIYNKSLKSKPGFSGKVTVRFTISPSGKIISIKKVSSTTGYPAFDSKVVSAIKRRFRFEKIKSGNTTVTIPFTFSE